jgi:hypothetical protein
MINILVMPLRAKKTPAALRKAANGYIQELFGNDDFSFKIIENVIDLSKEGLGIVLVETNYIQEQFWNILLRLPSPVFLLPIQGNGSIGAASDISSYLNFRHIECHLLIGTNDNIRKVIRTYAFSGSIKGFTNHIGVIISEENVMLNSYNVNYKALRGCFDMESVSISEQELVDIFNSKPKMKMPRDFFKSTWDYYELDKSYRLYLALKDLIKKYNLKGITMECFSLCNTLRATACLAYDKLTEEGYYISCHNNILGIICASISNNLFKEPVFQGSTYSLDFENNIAIFASSYVPTSMCESFAYDTESQTNLGVSIKGKMKKGNVTIFIVFNNLRYYFADEGTIIDNLDLESNPRATAIKVKLKDFVAPSLMSFVGSPIYIIYGNHKKELTEFFEKRGFNSYDKRINDLTPSIVYLPNDSFERLKKSKRTWDISFKDSVFERFNEGTTVTVFNEDVFDEHINYIINRKVAYPDYSSLIRDLETGKYTIDPKELPAAKKVYDTRFKDEDKKTKSFSLILFQRIQ